MYEGDESDAPCADVDEWTQAFESIKYFNSKEVDATDGENPFANEGTDGTDGTESDSDDGSTASLGERTIIFSLGHSMLKSIEMVIIIFMNFTNFLLEHQELKIYIMIEIEE